MKCNKAVNAPQAINPWGIHYIRIFDFIRALLVFTYLEDKSCTDCMLE